MNNRWQRLQAHATGSPSPGMYPKNPGWWLLELVFLLLDALGLPDLLMGMDRAAKFRQRPMNAREIILARTVFGEKIDYTKVRIDDQAHLGPRQFNFAYVGFYTIKCWGDMTDPLLIHELVHVWQYQTFGAVYIPRALWAQHFGGGYQYGGAGAMRYVHGQGGSLLDFNYEQMAEIVRDYYILRQEAARGQTDPSLDIMETLIRRAFGA
jgi:hypothetical protein